jgi:PBSX family phage terminase large subunit
MQIPEVMLPLFENPHTHNIIEGGRGGAKTRTIAGLIVWAMNKTPLKVICGREIQKSLKDSSFAVIRDEIYRQGKADRFLIKDSRSEIISKTGARAVFIGMQNHTIDSIKSYEGFHWFWGEESQSISKESLDIMIPTLRTDNYFELEFGQYQFVFPLRMFIYTMNPYTWNDPIKIVLPETREDTQYIITNYYNNPWFPESLEKERLEAKENMTIEEYNRIWEGIPFEDAEKVVISRKKVEDAAQRQASLDGGFVVGADIARFGNDKTVFYKRQGFQIIDKMILSKQDTQTVARHLHDFAAGAKIMIDDTGVGGGVTDKLKELKDNVVPINFGGKPMDKKKYPDIISEMWFNISDLIDEIGISNDNELIIELSTRYFKYTADERRKVESKEEYKKRTGRNSPDLADALILCFYNRDNRLYEPKIKLSGLGL